MHLASGMMLTVYVDLSFSARLLHLQDVQLSEERLQKKPI